MRGARLVGWNTDLSFQRAGRFIGQRNLPGNSPILRYFANRKADRERREEEAQRRKAEAEARERAESDRAQKEHDALVERPILPTSSGICAPFSTAPSSARTALPWPTSGTGLEKPVALPAVNVKDG